MLTDIIKDKQIDIQDGIGKMIVATYFDQEALLQIYDDKTYSYLLSHEYCFDNYEYDLYVASNVVKLVDGLYVPLKTNSDEFLLYKHGVIDPQEYHDVVLRSIEKENTKKAKHEVNQKERDLRKLNELLTKYKPELLED